MSENYRPDSGTEPEGSYATGLLSQRDLSLGVPINYVTTPGVSLTAACFPNGIYEDDGAAICFSNLLAVGFRRFELDLYWDQDRKLWSLCPIAIPTTAPNAAPSSTATTNVNSSSSTASISSTILMSSMGARQVQTATTTSSARSSLSGSSLGQANPTIAVLPNTSDTPLVKMGPYSCTATINLSIFISLFLDYIQKTENTLGAHLLHVILNLHAAVSASAPNSPAPTPSDLPGSSSYLASLFSSNLSAYLYTPTNLRQDRANINESWYTVQERYRPIEDYYHVTLSANGIASTDNGWPSESYVEFFKSKRLLLGWGSVDPQMAKYNFTDDSSIIFPNGYTQDIQTDVMATSSGRVTSGCFLRNDTDRVSQTNSSWAVDTTLSGFDYPTTTSSDIIPFLNLTQNTTQCGISPILNTTLLNTTANSNFHPYQNFSYSSIWSWAANEPRNYTPNDASSSSLFRCATINPDLSYRWVVADCSQRYYAACRAHDQPYNWTITSYPISYSYADQACPNGYDFAAPRTALENAYLGQEMRRDRRDYDGHGAWVDFNSLDIKGCWTVGGPNATCPYSETSQQMNDLQKRVILIPTIAAIIVLIVTAMTIFVKVAGNRRVRKRAKKRAENGFIYEGVPS